jgi:hypothetical protein
MTVQPIPHALETEPKTTKLSRAGQFHCRECELALGTRYLCELCGAVATVHGRLIERNLLDPHSDLIRVCIFTDTVKGCRPGYPRLTSEYSPTNWS